ncbi:MAG TPA: penicillin acylase family protein [Bryobacteraceae bacterium]|jgi:penicillin amidase|nr:penicillin acylase family protein [Bryobacteraceae bacterium]
MKLALALLLAVFVTIGGLQAADAIRIPGLDQQVEILRDRWGVPHIYASTTHDLFFAQGYITAKDRLFQIDLWRRAGTGKLSEILGPSAIERDKLARAVNYRGDWNAEWSAYAPDTKAIVAAFTNGINAYIRGLGNMLPSEFELAGYSPALWAPEDCLSRVAGLTMTGNLMREVSHAEEIQRLGLEHARQFIRLEPAVQLEIPKGLDLATIHRDILAAYRETVGRVSLSTEQGSNNWVVDGTMTATGRPILANDPHRPVQLPSLRKTVHLVGPGWDAIGSGEPALPGIAIGHNENIAFGLTIVGIDQQDLYVETLNPANPAEYRYRGAWKKFDTEQQKLTVKGQGDKNITLRYTLHGPVIYEDPARHHAYVLRWVGSEPGTAGYLAGLSLARAKDWKEFRAAMSRYQVPSENLVYADTKGNIGWQVGGLTPIRDGWSGLLPVPGEDGRYEWKGFQKSDDLPFEFNPARHYIATANNNILPPGYSIPLGYDGWALPFRVMRIREMLSSGQKFDIADFERMQQDVSSLPARRFQQILKKWSPDGTRAAKVVDEILKWNGMLSVDSRPALIYEVWLSKLPPAPLDSDPDGPALQKSLDAALLQIEQQLGTDPAAWQWGKLHQLTLVHPLGKREFRLGPIPRPGDANTVNATSGADLQQTNGASWREILDVGDWDRSVMTNVPGESGDPSSKHYGDLLQDWAAGRYHPMPFSRQAVEAATEERIVLRP